MEEERFEELDCKYTFGIKDNETSKTYFLDKIIDLLNQQDKRIKELQANNEILKTSKSHFKKVAENVVDLLGKLNKFIGEPQTRELNYCKVIEDTKNYIEELKQSQKQLAISELDEVNVLLTNTIIEVTENEFNVDKLCYLEEISSKFSEKIKDKIKKLKGSK